MNETRTHSSKDIRIHCRPLVNQIGLWLVFLITFWELLVRVLG